MSKENKENPDLDDEMDVDDGEFSPSADMLVHEYDDEATLDDEEEDVSDLEEAQLEELDDLEKERDMPLEKLLQIYGYGGTHADVKAELVDLDGGAEGNLEADEKKLTSSPYYLKNGSRSLNNDFIEGSEAGLEDGFTSSKSRYRRSRRNLGSSKSVVDDSQPTSSSSVSDMNGSVPGSSIPKVSPDYSQPGPSGVSSSSNSVAGTSGNKCLVSDSDCDSDEEESCNRRIAQEIASRRLAEEIAADELKQAVARQAAITIPAARMMSRPSHARTRLEAFYKDGKVLSSEEEGSSSDEDNFSLNNKRKQIRVGEEYQTIVPDICAYGDALPYENEDRLLWDPSILPADEVIEYLKEARQILVTYLQAKARKAGSTATDEELNRKYSTNIVYDDEQVLYSLVQCGYCIEEALRRRRLNLIPPSTMAAWSPDECENFEFGLFRHGKDFHQIQQFDVNPPPSPE